MEGPSSSTPTPFREPGTSRPAPATGVGWTASSACSPGSYCIDPERIYIAGFSAGAVFTLYLGCNVPGAFRAMAAVAGSDRRFDTSCCTAPISGLFIHGTQDEAIPLLEGQAARSNTLHRDGCSSSPAPDGPRCVGYACPAPYAVDYCEWGGDHDVPDWAGAEIARFFSLLP